MNAWPATAIERRKVIELVPYARNARTHSDAHIHQLMGAIKEWGWTNPILIDEDNGIVAGHGRVLAAQRLGLDEVPCVVARGWTKAQKQAYVLADNKLALNAGWNESLLAVELGDLKDLAFDISLIGFGADELDSLLNGGTARDGNGAIVGQTGGGAGSLAAKFGVPPFSVLNAREGWWQQRKMAWLELGIQSELGRGDTPSTSARVGPDEPATYRTIGGKANATPGGSKMPATSLVDGKTVRGDGRGRPANAIPGGGKMSLDRGYND